MPTPSEWEGNYKVYRVTVQKWGVPKKMPPPLLGVPYFEAWGLCKAQPFSGNI